MIEPMTINPEELAKKEAELLEKEARIAHLSAEASKLGDGITVLLKTKTPEELLAMGLSKEELEGFGINIDGSKFEPKKYKEETREQKAVEEAREKYAKEISKYKKETKIWDKMKHHITPEKKHAYINDKFPNVALLKESYDKARIELGNKMYFDKKMELEKTGKSDSEIKEELDEYKNYEIKFAIHFVEHAKSNVIRSERLPLNARESLNKTLEFTQKAYIQTMDKASKAYSAVMNSKAMDLYKKVGDWGSKSKYGHANIKGYDLTAGKLARSAVLGLGTGFAFGAAAYGIRFIRGTAIAMGGGIAISKMNAWHQQRLDILNQEKNDAMQSLSGLNTAEQLINQEKISDIEKRIRKEDRAHMLKMGAIAALMLGANWGAAKAENSMFGHGAEETGSEPKSKDKEETTVTEKKVEDKPKIKKPEPTTAPKTKTPEANNNVVKTPEKKSIIPKEAFIDSKHNIGITYAFRSQLEANSDLAHKLGYDVAPNKPQFLADLGKKLGYIGENGDVRVRGDGMGAAYVLHIDASGNPYVEEFQNGISSDTVHHIGDKFEDRDVQEKYEYYNENTPKNTSAGTKGEFDGEATSIAPSGTRAEGSADEFAGEAKVVQGAPLGDNNSTDGKFGPKTKSALNIYQTGNKDLLSTNGVAEELARRADAIANTNSAGLDNINIENTALFINEKSEILKNTFKKFLSNDYNHKNWEHVQYKNMNELASKDNPYEFASRGERKSVIRLLKQAKEMGIDYHDKTADQLVNDMTKHELGK